MADSNWKVTTLGEQVELLTGYPFKSAEYTNEKNGISLLRGDNIIQGRLRWDKVKRWPLTETGAVTTYFLNEGDVVVAMDRPWIEAGLKYACISKRDLPCLLVQRVARLRAKNALYQQFLRYIIGSASFTNHILGIQTGTAVPHISSNQIKEYRFLLPSLPEQRAIANLLGALNDKIELNRQINETLEAIVKAIFRSWFVEFDPVQAKLEGREPFGMDRKVADLFPEKFGSSKLGKVPNNWKLVELNEIATFTKGVSYKSEDLRESNMALVTLKSISRGGGYNQEGLKPYTGEFKPEQRLKSGEIVVAHTDLTQAAEVLGRAARVQNNEKFYTLIASLDLVVVRPSEAYVSNEFLYSLLSQDTFQEHAYSYANGTTVLHLSAKALPEYKFVLPPSNLIEEFTKLAKPFYQMIDLNTASSLTLIAIRDKLLPKLLSGEIRVKHAEKYAETLL